MARTHKRVQRPLAKNVVDYNRALFWREQGESITAIAKRLGRPRATVGDWVHGTGEWMEYRACVVCGTEFRCYVTRRLVCGDWCKRVRYGQQREERRAAHRLSARAEVSVATSPRVDAGSDAVDAVGGPGD